MQIEDFIVLIYIFLRIAPSSYLCYYPFLDDLRFSKKATALGFFAIMLLEWSIFIATDRNFDKLPTLFGPYLIYAIYYFAAIKGSLDKKIFCALLISNFEVVLQTLSMITERVSPTPGLYYGTATIVLGISQAAYFLWFYHAAKKFKQIFRSSKYHRVVIYSNYILFFNLLALILMRNFSEPRNWGLFGTRFLCVMPLFFFTHMVMELLKEKSENKIMSVKLNSLEVLRRNEKPYYNFVIETWQKSRRLRHDQKHLVILLNQLYEQKEYDKLGQNLRAILKYTDSIQTVKLYGNETLDGLLGYWQLQAQESSIKFNTDIQFQKINLNDIDLAIILGNALENAFTAVKGSLLTKPDSFVKVKIKEQDSKLLLSIENSYSGNIVRYNNKFYSAKRDFKEPGTGLENIKMIAEKYQGHCNVSFDNASFKLQLIVENISIDD